MTLDTLTSNLMTALVGMVAGVTFIVETVIRRDSGPGRLWAVAFFSGMATTIVYGLWAVGVGGDAGVAAGNAFFVLVPGFVWLGERRFNDRRITAASLLVAVLAVASLVAVPVVGAGAGGWGGWPVTAAALIVLFVAGAVESLRTPLRALRSAWALSAVLLIAAAFYAARVVVFLTAGPDSAVFATWFSTVSANIVTVALTVVAVTVCSVLRSNRTSAERYAWLSEGGVASDGVMRARTFDAASADIVERASWRGEPITVLVIRIEGLAEIRVARGGDAADAIVGTVRHAVRRYAPASAIVGEEPGGGLAVCAVAPTPADARRLGATLYRGCTEELADSESGLFPFVGIGVALTEDVGYDVAALLRGARDAARRATVTPGASVLLDVPEQTA